jgi:hypothetical protein
MEKGFFYPTGSTTAGRCVVCLEDEELPVNEYNDTPRSIERKLKEYLDENQYCVETWQAEQYMHSNGYPEYEMKLSEEMGGDMGGGFASLDSTPGMGNVATPQMDGTNSDFYSGKVGSGDKFPTLTVGTPAAKKRGNKRLFKSFEEFKKFLAKSAAK